MRKVVNIIHMVSTVLEGLMSEKVRLYKKHILDSEGKLKLYNPIVQSLLLQVLEEAGLEQAVKDYEAELNDEKEAPKKKSK